MSKIFTSTEFVRRLKDCAMNYPTKYQNGTIGQYRNGYFLFDCICLIKSILWGWNGNKNATYGGATYGSNGVPDQTLDWFLSHCSDVSSDFSKIEVGEYLWMNGHCGVYMGDGFAIECTPAFNNKVTITAVGNIGKKQGYGTRIWLKHGKLPYIEYTKQPSELDKLKKEIQTLNDKIAELNKTITEKEIKIEELININENLEEVNNQYKVEIDRLNKEVDKLLKEIKNLSNEYQVLFRIFNLYICVKK